MPDTNGRGWRKDGNSRSRTFTVWCSSMDRTGYDPR